MHLICCFGPWAKSFKLSSSQRMTQWSEGQGWSRRKVRWPRCKNLNLWESTNQSWTRSVHRLQTLQRPLIQILKWWEEDFSCFWQWHSTAWDHVRHVMPKCIGLCRTRPWQGKHVWSTHADNIYHCWAKNCFDNVLTRQLMEQIDQFTDSLARVGNTEYEYIFVTVAASLSTSMTSACSCELQNKLW